MNEQRTQYRKRSARGGFLIAIVTILFSPSAVSVEPVCDKLSSCGLGFDSCETSWAPLLDQSQRDWLMSNNCEIVKTVLLCQQLCVKLAGCGYMIPNCPSACAATYSVQAIEEGLRRSCQEIITGAAEEDTVQSPANGGNNGGDNGDNPEEQPDGSAKYTQWQCLCDTATSRQLSYPVCVTDLVEASYRSWIDCRSEQAMWGKDDIECYDCACIDSGVACEPEP